MGHSANWHREHAREARIRDEAHRGIPAMTEDEQEAFVERIHEGAHADLREWHDAGVDPAVLSRLTCPVCGLTLAQIEAR